MPPAEFTILFLFHSFRMVFLFFCRIVITLLTLCTCQCNFYTHNFHLHCFHKRPRKNFPRPALGFCRWYTRSDYTGKRINLSIKKRPLFLVTIAVYHMNKNQVKPFSRIYPRKSALILEMGFIIIKNSICPLPEIPLNQFLK